MRLWLRTIWHERAELMAGSQGKVSYILMFGKRDETEILQVDQARQPFDRAVLKAKP